MLWLQFDESLASSFSMYKVNNWYAIDGYQNTENKKHTFYRSVDKQTMFEEEIGKWKLVAPKQLPKVGY